MVLNANVPPFCQLFSILRLLNQSCRLRKNQLSQFSFFHRIVFRVENQPRLLGRLTVPPKTQASKLVPKSLSLLFIPFTPKYGEVLRLDRACVDQISASYLCPRARVQDDLVLIFSRLVYFASSCSFKAFTLSL
jgi:hypothetical protein